MNLLFSTQGKSLDLWYEVSQYLRQKDPALRVGYYVCDSRHYARFRQEHPGFPAKNEFVLKEWEILAEARAVDPDLKVLAAYEKKIGEPNLWGPLVADRRIYNGRKMSFSQDYAPRYSHDKMLAILQVALEKMDAFFEQVQPEVVISLYAATFGDYLAYLFGRACKAQTLDFRLARIQNYIVAAERIFEPCEYINARFRIFHEHGIPAELRAAALEFVTTFRKGTPIYEGMILGKKDRWEWLKNLQGSAVKIARAVKYFPDRFGVDHQQPDLAARDWHREVINPARQRRARRKFARYFLSETQLDGLDYVLYPMHTEPEIATTLWARPYLNQIEVVRQIAHSLPVGWKLVVKEHPATFGRRSLKYYEKLLEIPNVCFTTPEMKAADAIQRARLVCILASTVGFETLMYQKPLVVLGNSPYDAIPAQMLRKVENPFDLPKTIADMGQNYAYDEEILLSFVAAIIDASVPVNLVTDLLGKTKGRHQAGGGGEKGISDHPHLPVLAEYLLKRITEGAGPVV